MAYDGWLEYNGVELVNLSRTAQLAEAMGIPVLWTEPDSVQWIQDELGAVDYDVITSAPWYDAGYPASAEFAGIVPLSIPNLDDSTLTSTPVEYTGDGGSTGSSRNATLTLVANMALVATTDRGADYGKRWMDRVLKNSGGKIFFAGADLRYFRYAGADAPIAHRRDVKVTRGASVTRKRRDDCAATWWATFTLTAGDSYEYGEHVPSITTLGLNPLGTNLAVDPEAKTVWWTTSRWWGGGTGAGNWSFETGSGLPDGPTTFRRKTWTTGNTGGSNGDTGFAMGVIPATPGLYYSATFKMRASVARTFSARFSWVGGPSNGTFANGTTVAAAAGDWVTVSVTALAPAGVTGLTPLADVNAVGTLWAAGNTLDGTAAVIVVGQTPVMYGQTAFGPSVQGSGIVTIVQQTCPRFDYTPIYDPLYPALVESPTAPNLLPAGWGISDGMVFQRAWTMVAPVEPSSLLTVPIITLTTDVEARMVRVSIWPSDSPTNDQCGPLFSAIVSFLPAGQRFYIDGEQQAAYVWDGISPSVRRTDSLIYSPTATPVEWTAFTDSVGLLVTVDVFAKTGGFEGDGTVRAALDLIPKSD